MLQNVVHKALIFSLLAPMAATAQHGDCAIAREICKKQVYHFSNVEGEGDDPNEADDVPCFAGGMTHGNAEENSTWLRWKIEKSGSLTFAITPHRLDDDIDFVLFRLPGGSCRSKIIVRCMASGERLFPLASPCMGETGLRAKEGDIAEDPGCDDEDDNAWLRAVEANEGEEYALLISNVSTPGVGFSIRFGGSCKFPCDEEKLKAEKPAEKPVKKPAPKPVEKTNPALPVPAVAQAKPPKTIQGRALFSKKQIEVVSKKLKIALFDAQVVDGDVVSVWLDDRKAIDRVELRREPQIFEIEMRPGEEFLTVHAESFGEAPINTTTVIVDDGQTKQTLTLIAEPGKEESLRVVLKN